MDIDIFLIEHQVLETSLTSAEVAWLRREAPDALTLTPTGEPDRYLLKAGSQVGFIALPGGRLVTIKPKILVSTLFALLAAVYEPGQDVFRDELQSYTTVTELFEFVVRIFVVEVEALSARGLLHGYRTVTEDLVTVRGRLRLAETLHCHPALRDRHICAYSRFTADVPENRILRWTAFCLQPQCYREAGLSGRLHRLNLALSAAALDPDSRRLFSKVGFHRLNDPYRPALALARLLLDHLTFSGVAGGETFLAYLVDMNQLFERYLGVLLERELRRMGLRVQQQAHHPLDTAGRVVTKPDVIIYREQQPALVVDAKYKLGPAQGDLYQLLAYCHILGLPIGVLVHPAHEQAPTGEIVVRGPGALRLRYLTLDLSGSPARLEAQGRILAEQLVGLLK